jgi:hypothetical protein
MFIDAADGSKIELAEGSRLQMRSREQVHREGVALMEEWARNYSAKQS